MQMHNEPNDETRITSARILPNSCCMFAVCPEHHCLTRNGDADFKKIGL